MAYLAIRMDCNDGRSAALMSLIEERGWNLAGRTADFILWTGAQAPPQVRSLGAKGFVIGEIYDAGDGRAWPERPGPSHQASDETITQLCAHAFGRYVAVLGGREPAVFRDPSGGLDCLVWQIGPFTFVCDELERLPPSLQPPRLALDWDVICQCAASASLAMTKLALEGLCDVMPGTSRSLLDLTKTRTHWTPANFVRPLAVGSERKLTDELAARVDIVVKALVGRHERLVVEVSGGLDSAVVAGSIARLGLQERVVDWLNYFANRKEGDERAYACSVTDRVGAKLSSAHLPIRALGEADFATVARNVRPAFNALVPARDEDTAQRMNKLRATALVSGQGGDAIFYQMPSALILSDELHARGMRALASPLLPALARRLRRSIWSVMAEAWTDGARNARQAYSITALPREAARLGHPWIKAAAQASPAKRLQIIGLANAHVATGYCRISQIGELLYPLTAQPVAEFCLGLSAATLTAGGKERGLARQAFADRVPSMILERRKKGELTAFHAQTVAASLDFLRPHLLDGCLAEAGVLNRGYLEAALKSEQLLWRGEGSEILLAAALEAWVRHWQRFVPDSSQAGRRRLQEAGAR